MKNATQEVFEKIRINIELSASPELLGAKCSVFQEWATEHVRMSVHGFLWGKMIEHFEVRYPCDWWEALKQRFAPTWFLRRWPVRETFKEVRLQAIWPTLRLLVPGHGPRLILTVNGHPEGSYPGPGTV